MEQNRSAIVTLGITPSRPETGYGYICAAGASATDSEVLEVEAFKEKPDLETAKGYLAQGNYFWNAGIFVWNTATIVYELRKHAPQIAEVMDRMAAHFGLPDEREAVKELFPTCEKISIDYAVMEKARAILCCRVSSAGVTWAAGARCTRCCRRMTWAIGGRKPHQDD